MSDHIDDVRKKVGHTPTKVDLDKALLMVRGFDSETAEKISVAVNSYEQLNEIKTLLLKAKERSGQGLPLEYSELIKKSSELIKKAIKNVREVLP